MKFDNCVNATAWSNIKVKLMKINQGVEKNFILVVHLCSVKKDGFMLCKNLTFGKVVNPAQKIFAPFVFGGLVVDQSRQMPILSIEKKVNLIILLNQSSSRIHLTVYLHLPKQARKNDLFKSAHISKY